MDLEKTINSLSKSKVSDLDIDSDDLSVQKEKLKAQRYQGDTEDRRWLAKWSAIVVSVWLFLVIVILCNNSEKLHLSDTVLITLLGTTTLNILGLSFIVLRGHFNSSNKQ